MDSKSTGNRSRAGVATILFFIFVTPHDFATRALFPGGMFPTGARLTADGLQFRKVTLLHFVGFFDISVLILVLYSFYSTQQSASHLRKAIVRADGRSPATSAVIGE